MGDLMQHRLADFCPQFATALATALMGALVNGDAWRQGRRPALVACSEGYALVKAKQRSLLCAGRGIRLILDDDRHIVEPTCKGLGDAVERRGHHGLKIITGESHTASSHPTPPHGDVATAG